jgi:hypothetical protein
MAETSWISEQKRLLELQNDCEPEPMESINCQFIFIDSNNFIQKISKEKAKVEYDVENDQYIVSKKQLLQMIQKQKTAMNNSKYLYKHLCIFNIDLESEDVHPFTQESLNDNDEFFETISLMDDIVIDPSIFIFHQVNSLYFFFEEMKEREPEIKDVTKLKPILKIHPPISEIIKPVPSKRVTIKLNSKPSTTRKKH